MLNVSKFLVLFVICLVAVTAHGAALAQQNAPVISIFKIEKVAKDGRTWLSFTWRVENTDRVHLLQDGQQMQSRMQLPDGSFGWPAEMPGAFSIGTQTGQFTLVAQNALGRVEARANLTDKGCFAWLDPPGTHWQRCRAGGVIAADLGGTLGGSGSGDVRVTVGKCEASGQVRAGSFRVNVPRNPLNPQTTYDIFDLDHVVVRPEDGSPSWAVPLRAGGAADTRSYRVDKLKPGTSYILGLPGGWRARPQFLRVDCPRRSGTVRRHLGDITALGVSSD